MNAPRLSFEDWLALNQLYADYAHTVDASAAVMKARQDSRYIESTQGTPMKLNLCTWA